MVVLRDGHIVCTLKVGYEPQCAAVSPDQKEVAVGGGDGVCCVANVLTYHCFDCYLGSNKGMWPVLMPADTIYCDYNI